MKSKFLSILPITAFLAASNAPAQNTDGTWNANLAGNWSDTTKWSVGTVADGIGYSAFLSDVINADRIITLDTVRTIGNIYAQDASNNYSISGANTLTLDVGSGQSILNVTTSGRTLNINTPVTVNDGISKIGAGAVSITGAVTLGAAQTWTNNSAGALTKTNASLIDNDGHQLTFDGSGGFNLGTINNGTAVLTGSGALVKNGSGRLNIGGVNSGFTGTVAINGGVLQAHNNAGVLGVGNVALNGGVLSFYWSVNYNRTLGTGNNQVQILGGESGFAGAGTSAPTINLGASVTWGSTHFNPSKFVLGDEGTTNAANTTFSSGINLNGATRTIVVPKGLSAAGNKSTLSGAISNGTGTANLIKEGSGMLFLTNNSSAWSGSTTVSAGALDMGGINLANIGGGAGRNISVATGAVIRFNTLSNAILNRIVETTNEIGVMTGTTGNSFDFSSTGANLPNAFLGNYAGNGAKAEISGTITPGSNGYKFGSIYSNGLLGIRDTLSGANKLTVGQTGSSGIRVNIVAANTHSGETVINTGSRLTLGNNLALQNSPLNVGSAGGNFSLAAGTNSGRITGETEAASPTFGGLIGSRNLISVFSSAVGNNETNLAAAAVTGFTLNVASGSTFTYSGAIGGFGAGGASTLTKTGAGTQILSGANTYTGTTTVSAGVLRLNSANALPGGLGTSGGTSALILDGGVVGLGNANFQRGLGTGTTDVQWTGSGGFAAYGADRSVNLGGVSGGVTWDSGSFVPDGSTLILGSSGATHTVDFQNPIDLGASARTVQVDNGSASVDAILSGALSGGGGLTKTGAGTLQLSQATAYTGATTVSGGTLQLTGATPDLLSSSGLVLNGGTLLISNTDTTYTVNRLADGAPVTLSGSGVLNFSHTGGSVDYSETTGALTVTGSNNQIITSRADFGQTSTLTFASLSLGGGLQFTGDALGLDDRNRIFITGQSAGPIGLSATYFDPLNNVTAPAGYTLAGGVGPQGSDVDVDVLGGEIPDGSAAVSIIQAGSSGDITLGAPITSIESLNQTASQAGTIEMASEILRTDLVIIGNPNAPLTIGTTPGEGTITPKTVSGSLTLNNNYTAPLLILNAVIANNGSGSSLLKTGAGTVQITAGATYTGSTTIGAGTLTLTGAGSLPDTSAVTLSDSTSVLHLSGISATSETIGSLSGASGSSVLLGAKTLGLNGVSPAPFAGVISGSGGSLTLLAGASQTLTGDNTFTGEVTIGANATLSVNKIENSGAQPLGQGSSAIVMQGNVGAGSTLEYTGAGAGSTNRGLNLSGGAGGTVNVTSGTLTVSGELSGSANFHKAGTGKLVLTGSDSWNADGFVNTGTLVVGADTGTGSNSLTGGNWTVDSGATMRLNTSGVMEASTLTRNGTFNLEAGTLRTNTIAGSGAFSWGAGTIATLGNNTMGTVDRTDPLGSPSGPTVLEGNILNFTGNLSSTTGSTIDLGAPLLNNGLRYNQIRVTGTLDLSGADSLNFNINPYLLRPTSVNSLLTGDWGTLILVHAETITDYFDSITGIGSDQIGWTQLPTEYDSGRTAASLQLNEWVLEYRTGFGYGPLAGGDALLLHYRVAGSVPEPGSAGLLLGGVVLLRAMRGVAGRARFVRGPVREGDGTPRRRRSSRRAMLKY